jgi:hypothetical protein
MKFSAAVTVLLLLAPQQNVDDIVSSVSANVRAFREFIPGVVCTETMKSGEFDKDGKLVRPRTVESNFAPARINSGRPTFTPTREVVAVDGKALKKGAKPPADLVQSTDYPFVPNIVFGQANAADRDFRLAGTESLGGINAVVLEFVSKETQTTLRIVDPIRGSYVLKDSGKAWIHPETKQILKLEDRYLNDPEIAKEVSMTFGEFAIDGMNRWLPKTIRYSVTANKKKPVGFIAEYSNCRINRGQ